MLKSVIMFYVNLCIMVRFPDIEEILFFVHEIKLFVGDRK